MSRREGELAGDDRQRRVSTAGDGGGRGGGSKAGELELGRTGGSGGVGSSYCACGVVVAADVGGVVVLVCGDGWPVGADSRRGLWQQQQGGGGGRSRGWQEGCRLAGCARSTTSSRDETRRNRRRLSLLSLLLLLPLLGPCPCRVLLAGGHQGGGLAAVELRKVLRRRRRGQGRVVAGGRWAGSGHVRKGRDGLTLWRRLLLLPHKLLQHHRKCRSSGTVAAAGRCVMYDDDDDDAPMGAGGGTGSVGTNKVRGGRKELLAKPRGCWLDTMPGPRRDSAVRPANGPVGPTARLPPAKLPAARALPAGERDARASCIACR